MEFLFRDFLLRDALQQDVEHVGVGKTHVGC